VRFAIVSPWAIGFSPLAGGKLRYFCGFGAILPFAYEQLLTIITLALPILLISILHPKRGEDLTWQRHYI